MNLNNTFMKTPRLEIYYDKILENARNIINLCHSHGVKIACVTKVVSAHPSVVEAFVEAGADMLADSRLQNLLYIKQLGYNLPLMLLRIPTISEAEDVVRIADISLNSMITTIKALSYYAYQNGLIHKVIIMVDVGDLREGIMPEHVLDTLKQAKEQRNIEIIGLGCNLACYGGVIPTPENMKKLIEIRDLCRQETGLELPIISGGNSSGLPLLLSGKMPKEINHFRVGETILLGRNVIDRSPFPNTRQDTFIGVGEIIELEHKPSVPIGDRGQDAFGGYVHFEDRGIRLRAICNLGRQDVLLDNIVPCDSNITVLGGSSDHLILDVTDCKQKLKVGDIVKFYPGYGALLALSTSKYVYKYVIRS